MGMCKASQFDVSHTAHSCFLVDISTDKSLTDKTDSEDRCAADI